MTTTPARLRLVVVTYFPGAFLRRMVASVAAAATEPVTLTVVDNGSTDGTLEWAGSQPGLDLVRSRGNLGYGGGANLGVRASSEPWVLVANSDLTFAPGALDRLLAAADRWPSAGVLGPRIHTPEGLLYPSARELPSLGRGVGHALFGWIWPRNPWTAAYRREREAPHEGTTGWLSGACLLLRRAAFDEVGGFDESYFMYFEDTDLCERLGRAGWDVVYAPDAVVEHHGGHSTERESAKMSRAHHDSAYLYLSRRYAGPAHAPLRLVLRLGLAARHRLSTRFAKVAEGAQPTRRDVGGSADGDGGAG